MQSSGGRYGAVLRLPGVRRVLLPYIGGRTASTMVLLSVLLLVQRESRSFGAAGLLSACYATATAAVAPVLGRLVDRRGQARVLVVCGLLQPIGLVGLVVATEHHVLGLQIAAAALAGAFSPPLASCMRSLWPRLVEGELEASAWSIEGIVTESVELIGPLAVGALILLVSPAAALLAAAGLSAVGALAFSLTPASRAWASQRATTRRRLRGGPLGVPGVRALVSVVLVSTAALSAMEVAIADFASHHHGTGWTGVLFAAWLSGSLLGGVLFGARAWRAAPSNQLPVLLGLCGLTAFAPVLAGNLVALAGLLVVAGLAIAPATAVQFAVMSNVAPERRRTEAFTWASTAGFLGVAGGTSLSGAVVDRLGSHDGMLLSAALGLAAAGLAFVARGDLARSAAGEEKALEDAFTAAWDAHVQAVHDAAVPRLAPPAVSTHAVLARIHRPADARPAPPAVNRGLDPAQVAVPGVTLLPVQPEDRLESAIERLEAVGAEIARVTEQLRHDDQDALQTTGTDGPLAPVLPLERRRPS